MQRGRGVRERREEGGREGGRDAGVADTRWVGENSERLHRS